MMQNIIFTWIISMRYTTTTIAAKILPFVILLWVSFVFMSWTNGHADTIVSFFALIHEPSAVLNVILPFIQMFLVTILFYIYCRCIKKKTRIIFHVSWFCGLMGVLFFTVLTYNLAIYSRIIVPALTPALDNAQWLTHNAHLLEKLLFLFLWLMVFSLTAYLCGNLLMRTPWLHNFTVTPLLKVLITVALGFFVLSSFAFAFALIGIFTQISFVILCGGLIFIERRTCHSIIKQFFTSRKIALDLHSVDYWIVALIIFILSLTLIEILRAEPRGFDVLTQYFNKAQLIANSGTHVPGGNAYPFELLAAIGYLFGHDASFAVSTSLVYIICGFLTLFGMTQYFFGPHRGNALIAGFIFLVLPITQFFSFIEPKPDTLLFFFCALALWLVVSWMQDKAATQLLSIAALLLGFALSVKLTALFFIITLACIFVASWMTWHVRWHTKVMISVTMFMWFVLGMSPWLLYATATTPGTATPYYLDILSSFNAQTPVLDDAAFRSLGVDVDHCVFTGVEEDFSRYETNDYPRVLSFFATPWNLSVNVNEKLDFYAMEIGFIFLAILPVLIFSFFRKHVTPDEKRHQIMYVLLLGGGLYWTLWFALGRGVLWYGYAGYVFLILLTILTLHLNAHSKFIRRTLVATLLMGIIIHTLLRTSTFGFDLVLQSIGEDTNPYRAKYGEIAQLLNDTHPDTKILATAHTGIYYIEHNDQRVLRDAILDNFKCLNDEQHPDVTLKRLESLGIEYILLNKSLSSVGLHRDDVLNDKIAQLLRFANKKLTVEIDEIGFILYKVPVATK